MDSPRIATGFANRSAAGNKLVVGSRDFDGDDRFAREFPPQIFAAFGQKPTDKSAVRIRELFARADAMGVECLRTALSDAGNIFSTEC